ncbi:MAG: metal-dependent transcriptional regulator [Clostridia bacterium]|nr:metal-dependent transcriptional regulator [Clostridia bacterium]
MQKKNSQSVEDYLEAILILSKRSQHVRSIDIAKFMQVSKPSVSVAMKKLRESGHILMNSNGFISLTEEGQKMANSVYEKHEFLRNFFISIGVDEEIAKNDACQIEHAISEDVFNALKNYVNNKS